MKRIGHCRCRSFGSYGTGLPAFAGEYDKVHRMRHAVGLDRPSSQHRTIEGGKNLYFCDIGDLLTYLNKKKQPGITAEVKDYPIPRTWIDAGKAVFVQAPKKFNSPMGWGIAAFKDKKDGSAYGTVLDLAGAMKACEMTRVAALDAIIAGLLLIIVPRYILPACEYRGVLPNALFRHGTGRTGCRRVVASFAGAIVLLR